MGHFVAFHACDTGADAEEDADDGANILSAIANPASQLRQLAYGEGDSLLQPVWTTGFGNSGGGSGRARPGSSYVCAAAAGAAVGPQAVSGLGSVMQLHPIMSLDLDGVKRTGERHCIAEMSLC